MVGLSFFIQALFLVLVEEVCKSAMNLHRDENSYAREPWKDGKILIDYRQDRLVTTLQQVGGSVTSHVEAHRPQQL